MIARSRSVDWIRATPGRLSDMTIDAADGLDDAPPALDRMIASSNRKTLLHCLAGLEHRQRKAITAAFFGGLSYVEIDRQLGVRHGTVRAGSGVA
ncbi:RNA polymerase sigma factor [Brevundimonas aurifodinae]|uniref:Sigma factor-like helix-turn-helix DNA-binding protein n=1 Tax=Brevundimonas aurifodinae TaxID=1508312 RepID=A0ABV1NK33_9CAUL